MSGKLPVLRAAAHATVRAASALLTLSLAVPAPAAQNWPSFRGPGASGVAPPMQLPRKWDGESGEGVLWKVPIPGLAHSSPIVWGEFVYVTSALSGRGDADFKHGLYGEGTASADRSRHQWRLYALDLKTGRPAWQATVHSGVPLDKRHVKATYANSTPATDGKVVAVFLGSEGVFALDLAGTVLWRRDLGRLDAGAYDAPNYEWGNASSPIVWNSRVILQCDTQGDDFLIALDSKTGRTLWRTEREEPPSWGTPTVGRIGESVQLVTNGSNFIRGYDPHDGRQLWQLGGSSRITAPTPIFGEELIIVASGRRPEKPIFAIRPGARGDLTLGPGQRSSPSVAWHLRGRGPYMPTPLIYQGRLYVVENNGVLSVYRVATGKEIYRTRLPHTGGGFSASPVASGGRIYLSSEDGEIFSIQAGSVFEILSRNSMGERVMATPALSGQKLLIRGQHHLFAIGRKVDG